MSNRKNRVNRYTPRHFERIGGSKVSAVLFASMLQSKAYIELSNGAKVLYVYMKLQLYGARPIKEHPEEHFYFNEAMYTKTYKIGTNTEQFRKYRNELIEGGFISLVEYGGYARTKNIYAFSDKWQTGKKQEVPDVLHRKKQNG